MESMLTESQPSDGHDQTKCRAPLLCQNCGMFGHVRQNCRRPAASAEYLKKQFLHHRDMLEKMKKDNPTESANGNRKRKKDEEGEAKNPKKVGNWDFMRN